MSQPSEFNFLITILVADLCCYQLNLPLKQINSPSDPSQLYGLFSSGNKLFSTYFLRSCFMNKAFRNACLWLVTLAVLTISLNSLNPGAAMASSSSSQPAKVSSYSGPAQVFFPNYSQFVADPLLHFWRINGRQATFGGPISRLSVNSKGQTVQFFQKMALAYYPDTAEVRPYEIGRIFYEAQPDWVKDAAPFAKMSASSASRQQYFPESGHKVSFGFLDLYNNTGGLQLWGYPLSEEYSLTLLNGSSYTAQFFERGRMLWSSATGAVIDPNFGTLMANFNHADTTFQSNPASSNVPNYDTNLWEHWVDVNLSTQSETFYEGDVPIRTNLVATGKPHWETPTGSFYINKRVYNEHMTNASIGAEDYYDLYNVLYTQYFTYEGHALHYSWWRDTFGVTGSHGCVSEDYTSAEFAWNWLSLGSRVQIHY